MKNTKRNFLSLLCTLMLLAGCKKDNNVTNDSKPTPEIKLAYSSAMCQDYCDYIFIVNKNFKEITQIPGKALPSPELKTKNDTIMLTKTDWDKISRSFILDSVKALPKINGCPGCDD